MFWLNELKLCVNIMVEIPKLSYLVQSDSLLTQTGHPRFGPLFAPSDTLVPVRVSGVCEVSCVMSGRVRRRDLCLCTPTCNCCDLLCEIRDHRVISSLPSCVFGVYTAVVVQSVMSDLAYNSARLAPNGTFKSDFCSFWR